jgi:para-aminobenzoate synthetase / 4-amino-4-deoxychorismate lyase
MNRFRVVAGIGPALSFENPREMLRAANAAEAEIALERAGSALRDGAWIAGYVAYDVGAAFVGLPERAAGPALALGIFDEPVPIELPAGDGTEHSALLATVDRGAYDAAVRGLQRSIYDGDVYQVNYTVPFALHVAGDDRFAFWADRARRTGARYQAFVEDGTRTILSWSPELFLAFDGPRLITKPMKGTAPLDRIADLEGAKNRAEHVMIVDLLRNDLHRICTDVEVEELAAIERYPTFATMTSTIAGTLRDDRSLLDVFRAAFPCGSVTGAPKRSAMSFIAACEPAARGAYCGTVGFLSPRRQGWWNVAIRTAQFDNSSSLGRFDAGGGIVADSNAAEEWAEILLKARFLRPDAEAFALLETFAGDAEAETLELHFARLETSARAFGIDIDLPDLRRGVARLGCRPETLVRLRVRTDGSYAIAVDPLERTAEPVRLCVASARVQAGDPFLRHKTSWRPAHDAAAREARARECFDALLCNERDEVTEGARTSIFFRIDGVLWTPPLECGLLPGILRDRIVSEGDARERIAGIGEVRQAEAIYIGNSARGLLRATLV